MSLKYRTSAGTSASNFSDLVVKVGDTLPVGTEVDYDGQTAPAGWQEVDDPNAYSTSETRIGTWINGKPLYRQTFGFNVSNLGTETYFNWTDSLYNTNSISNVDEIINVKSFYKRSDDTFQPVPTVNRELNYYGSGVFDFSGTGFRFYVGTLFNTFTINYLIVTIEYTKTTD
jgi:hypothetical protein